MPKQHMSQVLLSPVLIDDSWHDNKVVSGISTLPEYGYNKVKRRIGKDRLEFTVPAALKSYQNYMGGVDNFDQIRDSAGGCSKGIKKTHKWFQKIILALFDAGIAQGSIAHNMFAKSRRGINRELKPVPIYHYQQFLVSNMLAFQGFRETRLSASSQSPSSSISESDSSVMSSEVQNFKWHLFLKKDPRLDVHLLDPLVKYADWKRI